MPARWGSLRFTGKSLISVAVCGVLAGLLCFLLRDGPTRVIAPLTFLLVVIPISHFWGILSGILGATAANLTFAMFLFPPLGSLAVQDPADRVALISFQVGAMGVAYLSSPRSPRV